MHWMGSMCQVKLHASCCFVSDVSPSIKRLNVPESSTRQPCQRAAGPVAPCLAALPHRQAALLHTAARTVQPVADVARRQHAAGAGGQRQAPQRARLQQPRQVGAHPRRLLRAQGIPCARRRRAGRRLQQVGDGVGPAGTRARSHAKMVWEYPADHGMISLASHIVACMRPRL